MTDSPRKASAGTTSSRTGGGAPDPAKPPQRLTVVAIRARKEPGSERLVCLTAYDHSTAVFLDQAGVDILLVGDSLGMVVLGYENTLPVTMEEMLHHTRAVARARPRAFVVADLPFMSYQVSVEEALRNAGRLIKEGGADAVKLEGGAVRAPAVAAMVQAGIPVMGHLGLTPQSVLAFGGFRVQGRGETAADRLSEDARALVEAGCFSIVLEGMPAGVAERVTREVSVPTIGIGAGAACDGQILVIHDLLGNSPVRAPKFVRRYAEFGAATVDAARRFIADVRSGAFPASGETYSE